MLLSMMVAANWPPRWFQLIPTTVLPIIFPILCMCSCSHQSSRYIRTKTTPVVGLSMSPTYSLLVQRLLHAQCGCPRSNRGDSHICSFSALNSTLLFSVPQWPLISICSAPLCSLSCSVLLFYMSCPAVYSDRSAFLYIITLFRSLLSTVQYTLLSAVSSHLCSLLSSHAMVCSNIVFSHYTLVCSNPLHPC